ncbi:MAG: NagC family transcriptional regulator [Crenarchaeota archaeon]|nr:NagC family transcriptional regulator [Thermoproteota archaeon]
MLPINPRDLQRQLRQLKRLGIKMEPVEGVERVVIELGEKAIIVESPQVVSMEFGGQRVFYVMGQSVREEALVKAKEAEAPQPSAVGISEDDVKFVAEYAGVDEDRARRALEKAGGDIAKAIELLQSGDA